MNVEIARYFDETGVEVESSRIRKVWLLSVIADYSGESIRLHRYAEETLPPRARSWKVGKFWVSQNKRNEGYGDSVKEEDVVVPEDVRLSAVTEVYNKLKGCGIKW